MSLTGARYFITIIDDFSKKVQVYLLKQKDQAFEKFKEWEAMMETQIGQRVKQLRFNNWLEYYNQMFNSLCVVEGIVRQKTMRLTPQQNGCWENEQNLNG